MNFEEYLISKKIDSKLFKENEFELWSEFDKVFQEMHPKSFTSQKLYLINGIRRKYQLTVLVKPEASEKRKILKPVVKTGKPITKDSVVRSKPIMKGPKMK
jgi:hypothetical protein